MGTYSRLADLPVEIDSYELEGLEAAVSSEFTRLSTVIHILGGGEEGLGEDVTYDALDHIAHQDAGAVHDLSGRRTLGELAELLVRGLRRLTFVVSLRLGAPPSIAPVSRRAGLYPTLRLKLDPVSVWT